MPQPQVIVFAGTVGAGKSTHMRLLTSALKNREVKVKSTFLKKGHFFTYILEHILALIFLRKKEKVPPMRALIDKSPHLFAKIFKLWLLFDVYFTAIKFIVNIYIPIKRGNTIIVEEYIPATIASYKYYCERLEISQEIIAFPTRILLRLMSMFSTQAVFFDAESNILKTRWNLRGSQMESDRYICMQRKILLPVVLDVLPNKVLYIRTDNYSISEVHRMLLTKFNFTFE